MNKVERALKLQSEKKFLEAHVLHISSSFTF